MVHKTRGVEGFGSQQCRDVWLSTLENLKNPQYCLPEAVSGPDVCEGAEDLEGSSGCFLLQRKNPV